MILTLTTYDGLHAYTMLDLNNHKLFFSNKWSRGSPDPPFLTL